MGRVGKSAAFNSEWGLEQASLQCCIQHSLEGDEGMDCVAVYGNRAFQVETVQAKDRKLGEHHVFIVFYKRTRKASVDSYKK